jgi:hypothetical protein
VRQRLTRALTLEDLFVELNARPMSPDDTVELLKWWIAKMARTSAYVLAVCVHLRVSVSEGLLRVGIMGTAERAEGSGRMLRCGRS